MSRFIKVVERFSTRVLGPLPKTDPLVELKGLDAVTGQSVWGSRGQLTFKAAGLKTYYDWYDNDGVVFASVNGLAEAAVGQGYFNKVEEELEKDADGELIIPRNLQLVDELGEELNFDHLHPNICKNMLIAGHCPVEFDLEKFPSKCAVKILHPLTITGIKLGGKEYHGIESIQQTVGDQRVIIEGTHLVWYVHNQIGNDVLGTSIIKPVSALLATKQTAIENMSRILDRRLAPLIIWKTMRDIGGIREAVSQRLANEDLFLSNLTLEEMKDIAQVVEVSGDVKFWEYIEYIDRLIYVGLYAPNLYYWRDATQASANVLDDIVMRNINAIQRNVKRGTEKGFYERLMEINNIEEVPRLIWGVERTGAEDLQMENIITELIKSGMFPPEAASRLLKTMGLNVGELGWITDDSAHVHDDYDEVDPDSEDDEVEDETEEKMTKIYDGFLKEIQGE